MVAHTAANHQEMKQQAPTKMLQVTFKSIGGGQSGWCAAPKMGGGPSVGTKCWPDRGGSHSGGIMIYSFTCSMCSTEKVLMLTHLLLSRLEALDEHIKLRRF